MGTIRVKKEIDYKTDSNGMVEVLYQKMGDRWFAFSLVGDEVFVGSITQDELEQDTVSVDPASEPASIYPRA